MARVRIELPSLLARFADEARSLDLEAETLRGALDALVAHCPALEVHLFDERGSALNGEAPGLFSFRVPGARLRTNWGRAGLELEHAYDGGVTVSASVQGSTRGRDPSLSGGLSVNYAF